MGIKRYALNDAQWTSIALLPSGKAGAPRQERMFVSVVLGRAMVRPAGVLRPWKTVHWRFSRTTLWTPQALQSFTTSYNRRTIHFAGFVHLAAAMIWLH